MQIINDWNNATGKKMASSIRRRMRYEHEGISKDGTINGIHNRSEYRTLQNISNDMLPYLIAAPEKPSKAEWVNYTNTPGPDLHYDNKCRKIPAHMQSAWGSEYLNEEDWKIEVKH